MHEHKWRLLLCNHTSLAPVVTTFKLLIIKLVHYDVLFCRDRSLHVWHSHMGTSDHNIKFMAATRALLLSLVPRGHKQGCL